MPGETAHSHKEITKTPTVLLSTSELAERWGVSENFIRRLVWKSELPCTRIGRTMRFSVEDVDRYVREHTGLHDDDYQPANRR